MAAAGPSTAFCGLALLRSAGHVGALVAQHLVASGARLVVSDVDTSRRGLVESLGAVWVSPEDALDVDVLVPCAVGGVLTAGIAGDLRRAAVVGAANNQLDHDATADLLPARGVLRAPDPVVSAGGVIASVAREREGASAREAEERVRGIGARLGALLAASAGAGTTPLHETRRLVRELLPAA